LTNAEAVLYIQPTNIFGGISNGQPVGNGWVPQLAPNIISQPTNQIVSSNQAATFIVGATGIPAPAFQWFKYGTPILGATNGSLTISNCQPSDAAIYSVIVSNNTASVASAGVGLTVGSTGPQPVLSSPVWLNGQFYLSVNGATGAIYSVQASTNFTQWQTVFATNSPPLPFSWVDTNTGNYPQRYYRVQATNP